MKGQHLVKNIFAPVPNANLEEIFDSLCESKHTHIERIVTEGQVTPEDQWYDQPRHEWVLLLQGAARLRFATDEMVELKPGDHLQIPAHTKHRVDWTTDKETTFWLAVHYD